MTVRSFICVLGFALAPPPASAAATQDTRVVVVTADRRLDLATGRYRLRPDVVASNGRLQAIQDADEPTP